MNIPTEMQLATQWGSHLPALLACIAVTDGPILELGVGHFSTPHLHAICGAVGRVLWSVEGDEGWWSEFKGRYGDVLHHVLTPEEFAQLPERQRGWGVSFIDHSPGGANRAIAFKWLIRK